MGIVSQLRDAQGGDADMGTLADLLRGLAEGRNVDTTPYGMWGVRHMNPAALASAMDAASKTHEAQLAAEMGLLGHADAAAAHVIGTGNMADAAMYGHDVSSVNNLQTVLGQQLNNEATNRMHILTNAARNASLENVANITAQGKNEKTVPWAPMVATQVAQQLAGMDKLKPEEQTKLLGNIIMLGKMNRYDTSALEEKLANIGKIPAPTPGPGITAQIGSGMTNAAKATNPYTFTAPTRLPMALGSLIPSGMTPEEYYANLP